MDANRFLADAHVILVSIHYQDSTKKPDDTMTSDVFLRYIPAHDDSYFWNYTSSYSDCTNVNYWYDLAEVAGVYIER